MTWTTMMKTTNSEGTGSRKQGQEAGAGGSERKQDTKLLAQLALTQKNPFDLQPAPASCSYFLFFPA